MQFVFFSSLDHGLFFARAHCSRVAILKQRVETSLPVDRSASTIPNGLKITFKTITDCYWSSTKAKIKLNAELALRQRADLL